MKKIITFSLLFIPFVLWSQTSKELNLNNFKNCWKIKDIVYEADGGMYTTQDEQNLKGKLICFNTKVLNILGDTILNPSYSLIKESTVKFVDDNFDIYEDNIKKFMHITANTLTVVKINKGLPEERELAYDGCYLYLPDNGALFRLKRNN